MNQVVFPTKGGARALFYLVLTHRGAVPHYRSVSVLVFRHLGARVEGPGAVGKGLGLRGQGLGVRCEVTMGAWVMVRGLRLDARRDGLDAQTVGQVGDRHVLPLEEGVNLGSDGIPYVTCGMISRLWEDCPHGWETNLCPEALAFCEQRAQKAVSTVRHSVIRNAHTLREVKSEVAIEEQCSTGDAVQVPEHHNPKPQSRHLNASSFHGRVGCWRHTCEQLSWVIGHARMKTHARTRAQTHSWPIKIFDTTHTELGHRRVSSRDRVCRTNRLLKT
jgi:hypothetical protein